MKTVCPCAAYAPQMRRPRLSAHSLAASADRLFTLVDGGIAIHDVTSGQVGTIDIGANNGVLGMVGDGEGGLWATLQMVQLETLPECADDDGNSALFHFDADGECTFRGRG